MDDDARDVIGSQSARVSFDADVSEAVGRVARLEDVAVAAGGDVPVDLAERQRLRDVQEVDVEVGGGQVAGGVQVLAVPRVSVVPSGPRSDSRTHPLMFWPRSTTERRPAPRSRRPAAVPRRGARAARPGATIATSTSRATTARPAGSRRMPVWTAGSTSRRSSRWPPMRSAAGRARDRCASARPSPRRRPPVRGPQPRAAGAGRCRCRTGRRHAGSPTCPRNQPSASSTATTFGPGRQQVRDVVGLALDPLRVLRVARARARRRRRAVPLRKTS